MPMVEQWESFFYAPGIIDSFGFRAASGDIMEFGCGYGTFTVAAAPRTRGRSSRSTLIRKMVVSAERESCARAMSNLVRSGGISMDSGPTAARVARALGHAIVENL